VNEEKEEEIKQNKNQLRIIELIIENRLIFACRSKYVSARRL
jgi:hypothetical protein